MEKNQILCGESASILKQIPTGSIDLVVTDPPYLCRYKDRDGRSVLNDNNSDAVLSVFDEIYRAMKPDSYCISFYGWKAVAEFTAKWSSLGFRTVGHFVWRKPYASKTGFARYCHESAFVLAKGHPKQPDNPINDVLPWEYTGNKAHPTEKAVSVIAPLVRSFSKRGDVVLDPFLGSGTTAVAAALTGRDYLGIELEPRYCEIARRRLGGITRKYAEVA